MWIAAAVIAALALAVQPAAGRSSSSAGAGAGAGAGAASGGLYVALGDSVTAGALVPPGSGYVDLLFAHYETAYLSNRAVPSETSATIRAPGAQLDKALDDIDGPTDTRVVTIGIGGSDVVAPGACDVTTPECANPLRANISATLADLQAVLAGDPGEEPLIAMAYYNPLMGDPGEAAMDRQLLGESVELRCADSGTEVGLNDIIAQEAAAEGALLANVYPAFEAAGEEAYLIPDDIHPNQAGHAAIAKQFREAVPSCVAPAFELGAKKQELKRKLVLSATVGADSAMVAKGEAIEKATRELAANEKTKFKVRLTRKAKKDLAKQLERKGKAKTKVKGKVLTEAGGTATDTVKVRLRAVS